MAGPIDLTVSHHVHELEEDLSLGTYLGGAKTAAEATSIACAVFVSSWASDERSGVADRIIAVVDDQGATVSWIGKSPVQVP